jgi:hypothetical protein
VFAHHNVAINLQAERHREGTCQLARFRLFRWIRLAGVRTIWVGRRYKLQFHGDYPERLCPRESCRSLALQRRWFPRQVEQCRKQRLEWRSDLPDTSDGRRCHRVRRTNHLRRIQSEDARQQERALRASIWYLRDFRRRQVRYRRCSFEVHIHVKPLRPDVHHFRRSLQPSQRRNIPGQHDCAESLRCRLYEPQERRRVFSGCQHLRLCSQRHTHRPPLC